MKKIKISSDQLIAINVIKIGLMNKGWSESEAERAAIEQVLKPK